jgi:hypothetical protein
VSDAVKFRREWTDCFTAFDFVRKEALMIAYRHRERSAAICWIVVSLAGGSISLKVETCMDRLFHGVSFRS